MGARLFISFPRRCAPPGRGHGLGVLGWVVGMTALGACQLPALEEEPYAFAREGTVAVSARPALFTDYRIGGDFTSVDFTTGDDLVTHDGGDIIGRFGLALGADLWLSPAWMLTLGADYRTYDVEGLTPSEELDITIDEVDSLQYFVAARHLFEPFDDTGRLRPFGQVSLAYLPNVDIGFTVDLSAFGSSDLVIDASGESYWVAGLAGGLVLQLTDRWLVEFGLLYEFPLTDLDVDLGFEIAGNSVPLDARLQPEGLVGSVGLTWVPGRTETRAAGL